MKLYHYLESVNYEARTGVFKFARGNEAEWTVLTVNISNILMSRMLNMKSERKLHIGKSYAKHLFITDDEVDQSKRPTALYNESPFTLVHFIPNEGVDAVENYQLECVDEVFNGVRDSLGNVIRDAITGKVAAYDKTIKYLPKVYWLREVRRYITRSTREYAIALPNMHKQAIRFN